MKINDILNQIDSNILIQVIGQDRLNSTLNILNTNDNKINLSELLLSFYGNTILEQKNIRKEVIKNLPEIIVRELSLKYCGKTFSTNESASIQLSAKPWTITNNFAYDLIRSLGISMDYLPKRINRQNTVEIIEPIKKNYPLFDYQETVKKKALELLENDSKKFVIQMPTGSGKTKTCIETILSYNTNIQVLENEGSFLWIAHTEELCEQAIETLKTIWGNTQKNQLRIVRFWGGYEPSIEEVYGSFIFSSYQKLCSKKSERIIELLQNSVRVVIIDEAHKALAKTYNNMLKILCSKGAFLIGLTATPGRSFKEILPNSAFANFFNREIITPDFKKNPIEALRDIGILSKLDHLTIESNYNLLLEGFSDSDDLDFSTKQLKALSENTERNRLIINILKNEVELGHPCLVFTCSIEHSAILTGALKFLGFKADFIDSRLKKTDRERIILDFKNGNSDILLNFGVLTTGFDAPRIKTVVIARPTTSIVLYSQMIGRGLRGSKMGGNNTCRIVDIKDNLQDFGLIENIYNFFNGYWD